MKITNKRNLPEFFVRATDPYKRIGDVSATGLLDPIQKTVIVRRFWDEVEEDAASRLWAIFGRAVHSIFEESERAHTHKKLSSAVAIAREARASNSVGASAINALDSIIAIFAEIPVLEERVAVQIVSNTVKPISIEEAERLTDQPHEGLIVSGCADHIDRVRKHINDIKVTKTWAHKYGGHLVKWTEQLSVYQLIYGLNGVPIETASVLEMLRNWDEYKLEQEHNYPEHEVYEIPIDLLPEDETFALITRRGNALLELLDAPLEELPPCTDEDRWTDPPTFAVYGKKEAKRATKLFKVERGIDPQIMYDSAKLLAASKGGTAYVEERPARHKRCEKWCTAAPFCLQWKALQDGSCIE